MAKFTNFDYHKKQNKYRKFRCECEDVEEFSWDDVVTKSEGLNQTKKPNKKRFTYLFIIYFILFLLFVYSLYQTTG